MFLKIITFIFYDQLKKNGMEHSFKDLYQKLNYLWDEYGIPYNKRKKLLLVEIEMVSLLMCDVLPSNYSEQGVLHLHACTTGNGAQIPAISSPKMAYINAQERPIFHHCMKFLSRKIL